VAKQVEYYQVELRALVELAAQPETSTPEEADMVDRRRISQPL